MGISLFFAFLTAFFIPFSSGYYCRTYLLIRFVVEHQYRMSINKGFILKGGSFSRVTVRYDFLKSTQRENRLESNVAFYSLSVQQFRVVHINLRCLLRNCGHRNEFAWDRKTIFIHCILHWHYNCCHTWFEAIPASKKQVSIFMDVCGCYYHISVDHYF